MADSGSAFENESQMNQARSTYWRKWSAKLVLEGGWVQKKLFDVGWSNESKCQACHKEEGTEKQRLYQCPGWNEVRRQSPEARRKWEQIARTSKKEWMWQPGIVSHPLKVNGTRVKV